VLGLGFGLRGRNLVLTYCTHRYGSSMLNCGLDLLWENGLAPISALMSQWIGNFHTERSTLLAFERKPAGRRDQVRFFWAGEHNMGHRFQFS